MKWPNLGDSIQLIILLFVFGSMLVQFIYRTFFRQVGPQRGGPRPHEAEGPAKGLREFLEEIREEARRAQQPSEPSSAPVPAPAPAPRPRQAQRRQVRSSPPAPRPAEAPAAPPVRRLVELPETSLNEQRAEPGDQEPADARLASVHSYLERLASVPGAPEAAALRRGGHAPLAGLGIGLRELVLAEAILGPPRSRSPRRRPGPLPGRHPAR